MNQPVVAVLLASPLDDVPVAGTTVRQLAEGALAGIPIVERVPDDALVVVHDPACPTVPASFVREMVETCRSTGRPQVAVLGVTDTIKQTVGESVGATLDRETLGIIASPIVLPAGTGPSGKDVVALVDALRSSGPIDLVAAPREAIRLIGAEDVAFLRGL